MADVTAELEFAPRPRPRRVSGPAAPRRRAAASGAGPAAAPVRTAAGTAGRAAARPAPVRASEPEPEPATYSAETAAAVVPGAGIAGRRTVTIHGRGAERYTPPTQRRRPTRRPHEREGFRPDRVAMWAVMLGLILVLVAATSSHAAAIGHRAVGAHRAGIAHRQTALVRHGDAHHTRARLRIR